jgi:cytoskeleton protein RodZ
MFEIGSALHEARERKGLSYSQVEEDTKIRARYIRALEAEDFGVLPGSTYSKGFLRAYADYLGLDGHLFIDEFNSRYHDPRNEDDKPIYPPSRRRVARQRRETNVVLIALAAIVAVATIVFVGAGTGNSNRDLPTPPSTPSSSQSTGGHTGGTSTAHTSGKQQQKKSSKASTAPYRIVITASAGDSWLYAHLRTASGPDARSIHHSDLGQYLLHQGETATIQATGPVVLTLGAPGSITMRVAGHARTLPPGTRFRITRSGITRA